MARGVALLTILACGPALARAADKAAPPASRSADVTHVDATGAEKLLQARKAIVLDIRTPEEYAAGHIRGATNLNFNAKDFEQRLGRLDKAKTYLVHCAGGGRSTKSLPVLKKLGFKSVVHLDGGITAWQQAGKPVEH